MSLRGGGLCRTKQSPSFTHRDCGDVFHRTRYSQCQCALWRNACGEIRLSPSASPLWEEGRFDSQRRVVRGGAFNTNDRNVRCAYRNNDNPNNLNRNQGFRVVLSHGLVDALAPPEIGCDENFILEVTRAARIVPGRAV